MEKILRLEEAPQKVRDLLLSGEKFGEFDTIYHCLFYGWLDLYEITDGRYYVGTRISINNVEHESETLARLSNTTYGSDAVIYQCIQKNYLELVCVGDNMLWVHRELALG